MLSWISGIYRLLWQRTSAAQHAIRMGSCASWNRIYSSNRWLVWWISSACFITLGYPPHQDIPPPPPGVLAERARALRPGASAPGPITSELGGTRGWFEGKSWEIQRKWWESKGKSWEIMGKIVCGFVPWKILQIPSTKSQRYSPVKRGILWICAYQ